MQETQKSHIIGRAKTELSSFSSRVRPTAVTSCRAAPRPVQACVWRYVVRRTCVPESGSQLLLRSANTRAWCSQKGSPLLGPGKDWVGARPTVAHKRISAPHKDSGLLLSLTRSTKEVTFVCLGGRSGCGRTVRAPGVGGGGGTGGGARSDRRGG